MPGDKFNYGKPLFNLEIEINYPSILKDTRQKELSHANGLFSGKKFVTDKGYIRSGEVEGLEHRTATLDFVNNLSRLDNIVNMREHAMEVIINYNDMGSIGFIGVNKKGLTLSYSDGIELNEFR